MFERHCARRTSSTKRVPRHSPRRAVWITRVFFEIPILCLRRMAVAAAAPHRFRYDVGVAVAVTITPPTTTATRVRKRVHKRPRRAPKPDGRATKRSRSASGASENLELARTSNFERESACTSGQDERPSPRHPSDFSVISRWICQKTSYSSMRIWFSESEKN